jgi:hypothetical protein
MYADSTQVPKKVVIMANFVEWLMLILVAGGVSIAGIEGLPIYLRVALSSGLIGLSVMLGYTWQPTERHWLGRLSESSLWVLLYSIAWWLGGVVIYQYMQSTPQILSRADIVVVKAFWIWAVSGGGSMLFIFVPVGLGIREISLTWLLQPYLPISIALVVAVLIRFVYTLADFVWGTLGWWLNIRLLKGSRSSHYPV